MILFIHSIWHGDHMIVFIHSIWYGDHMILFIHSIWYGDHNRSGNSLCYDWNVWHAIGARHGSVSTYRTAAGDSWTDSIATG